MRIIRSDIFENLMMALATLRANKLRSFLTVVGVVIGIITVMLIASIISGIDVSVKREVESFGTRSIYISKYNPGIHIGRMSREERMRKELTYDDAIALQSLPAVELSVPFLDITNNFFGGKLMVSGGGKTSAQVALQGTLPEFEKAGTQVISEGRFFTQTENDQNNVIYVPFTVAQKLKPNADDIYILAVARPGLMDEAKDQVRDLLRVRRQVPFAANDNFGMETSESILDNFRSITGGLAIAMVVISSVGLMVGGIGVMNIMLVSVTERTREIGVRKAIGAKKSDIMWQFLIEAATLTGLGGIVGLSIGWGLTLLLRLLLPSYVPLCAPVGGLLASVGIGLIFGLWPAWKAARLDPIESLRYE